MLFPVYHLCVSTAERQDKKFSDSILQFNVEGLLYRSYLFK